MAPAPDEAYAPHAQRFTGSISSKGIEKPRTGQITKREQRLSSERCTATEWQISLRREFPGHHILIGAEPRWRRADRRLQPYPSAMQSTGAFCGKR